MNTYSIDFDSSKDVKTITEKKGTKTLVKVKNPYALKSKIVDGPPIDRNGGKVDWSSLVKKKTKICDLGEYWIKQ